MQQPFRERATLHMHMLSVLLYSFVHLMPVSWMSCFSKYSCPYVGTNIYISLCDRPILFSWSSVQLFIHVSPVLNRLDLMFCLSLKFQSGMG